MRRGRSVREYRDKLLRNRTINVSTRRKQEIATQSHKKSLPILPIKIAHRPHRRRLKTERPNKLIVLPSSSPSNLTEFKTYQEYKYTSKTSNILHVINSVGLGGAQIMMMELVNGLNQYYEDNVRNKVLYVCRPGQRQKLPSKLYQSYGVIPDNTDRGHLSEYCQSNKIDILVHHRTSNSDCLRANMPSHVKYVLINHTWNYLHKMVNFRSCDFYVSVCNFLSSKTKWSDFIHKSRRATILNGIESNYINNLQGVVLDGLFKTGRCHRLVPSKFQLDSIDWMDKYVSRTIAGFRHYLIGSNKTVGKLLNNNSSVKHLGMILDRYAKMSVLKSLDLYLYETFQDEGASIAILESLACGVPVICKRLGGNDELITKNVNGFLVSDRLGFLDKMLNLSKNQQLLSELKTSTQKDFDERLHVRHTACKYVQLFESLLW